MPFRGFQPALQHPHIAFFQMSDNLRQFHLCWVHSPVRPRNIEIQDHLPFTRCRALTDVDIRHFHFCVRLACDCVADSKTRFTCVLLHCHFPRTDTPASVASKESGRRREGLGVRKRANRKLTTPGNPLFYAAILEPVQDGSPPSSNNEGCVQSRLGTASGSQSNRRVL